MVKQVSKKSYLIKKSCVFSDMQHNKQPDSDVQRAKKPFQGWRNQGSGAQCVELELRWQFCVHGSICPEIYF